MATKADITQVKEDMGASEKRLTEKIDNVDRKVEIVNTNVMRVETEVIDALQDVVESAAVQG
ncbi:MAG: hypothetical protein NVSMB70_19590 [Chamaesiphon sp.]